MATKTIPQLTALGAAPATDDLLEIADTSASSASKSITVANLFTSPALTTPNLGTPSAVVLTNATGTAASLTAGVASAVAVGGVTGLGTGVGTALAVNVGSAGAPVLFNGALGTPSSGTLTNASGLVATTGLTATGTKNSTTFLRGDDTWATPAGSGTVTVVGAGSLTSTALVTGGGTTTLQTPSATATMDTSGNISTPGTLSVGTGGSTAGAMVLTQGTTQSTGTTNITLQAPTSVTSYIATLPGAVGSTGVMLWTVSGSVATLSSSTTLPSGTAITNAALTTPTLGTPASGTLTNCTVDGTNLIGYRGAPQQSKSAAYTTVLADAGYCIFHPASDANARTFTIDSNANVAYPVGTILEFLNMSANNVTIAITSDTMTLLPAGTTGSRTLAQYGRASAEKISSTAWVISGNSALT